MKKQAQTPTDGGGVAREPPAQAERPSAFQGADPPSVRAKEASQEFGVVHGDSFGTGILGLGDVDGDGVPDFVVSDDSRSRWFEGEGWIGLVSGKTLGLIWEAWGGRTGERIGGLLFSVGDLDGDGVEDIASRRGGKYETKLLSGANGYCMYTVPAQLMTSIPDRDGDGRNDVAFVAGPSDVAAPPSEERAGESAEVLLASGHSGRLLSRHAVARPGPQENATVRLTPGLANARHHVLLLVNDRRSFPMLELSPPPDLPEGLAVKLLAFDMLDGDDDPAWAGVFAEHNGAILLAIASTDGVSPSPVELRPRTGSMPYPMVVEFIGDIDGDGVQDLFAGFRGPDPSSIEAGTWSGAELRPVWLLEVPSVPAVRTLNMTTTADSDADGVRDVLVSASSTSGGPEVAGWVQLHSGRTGQRLWQMTLADVVE